LRISDCGFMESLRSINYNGPFDTEAHDRQNSLNLKSKFKNLKLHPTCRGTKMGLESLYESKQFSPPHLAPNPDKPELKIDPPAEWYRFALSFLFK